MIKSGDQKQFKEIYYLTFFCVISPATKSSYLEKFLFKISSREPNNLLKLNLSNTTAFNSLYK